MDNTRDEKLMGQDFNVLGYKIDSGYMIDQHIVLITQNHHRDQSLISYFLAAHRPLIPKYFVMSFQDKFFKHDWPKMPDGSDFDGKQLLNLVHNGNSPFHKVWDVNLLIRETEENLGDRVIDIPVISKGSNNYVSL